MRRASTIAVLLVAALAAHGACFAQAPASPRAVDVDVDAQPAAHAGQAASDSAPAIADGESRSAFGKVMGVMIGALQRQSRERAHPARPVRTTAAGAPTGIQVGAAFREALSAESPRKTVRARKHGTGTGGAAAATVPRAAPPEDPALRQAALAGPG